MNLVSCFFEPKSLHFAEYLELAIFINPIIEGAWILPGRRIWSSKHISKHSTRYKNLRRCKYKLSYQDAITVGDMPLVHAYYSQVYDHVFKDIMNRGLTVKCAVKRGESIIRRNVGDKRIVVGNEEDMFKLIEDMGVYSFIPDIHFYGVPYPNKAVFDVDPSARIPYKLVRNVTQEFFEWLKNKGFEPKLRRTGGKGFHIILIMEYSRIPKSYSVPFPRDLKFETLYERRREEGVLWYSFADFMRLCPLAFAVERKREGRGSPITLEVSSIKQRFWNIFVDWTRSFPSAGARSLGSIHHKTAGVCMPLIEVPAKNTLKEVIKSSMDPGVEVPSKIDVERYKSEEIYLVGHNPDLLFEPYVSPRKNPMSLVNEIFEEYSWIVRRYVTLGPEKFYAGYVWP